MQIAEKIKNKKQVPRRKRSKYIVIASLKIHINFVYTVVRCFTEIEKWFLLIYVCENRKNMHMRYDVTDSDLLT